MEAGWCRGRIVYARPARERERGWAISVRWVAQGGPLDFYPREKGAGVDGSGWSSVTGMLVAGLLLTPVIWGKSNRVRVCG